MDDSEYSDMDMNGGIDMPLDDSVSPMDDDSLMGIDMPVDSAMAIGSAPSAVPGDLDGDGVSDVSMDMPMGDGMDMGVDMPMEDFDDDGFSDVGGSTPAMLDFSDMSGHSEYGATPMYDGLRSDVDMYKSYDSMDNKYDSNDGMDKSMEYRGMSREPSYRPRGGRGRMKY